MSSKINPSTEPQHEGEGGEHPTPLQSKAAVQPEGNVEVEQPKATPAQPEKNATEAGE